MSAKFSTELRYYCLRVNESPEASEEMAVRFETEFSKLGKYDQLELSQKIQVDGWEEGFKYLGLAE